MRLLKLLIVISLMIPFIGFSKEIHPLTLEKTVEPSQEVKPKQNKKKVKKKPVQTSEIVTPEILDRLVLSDYEKEKEMLEQEILNVKEESQDLSVSEKKERYFKEIGYESTKMKRIKNIKKIEELPVDMMEDTDVIELKIN